MTNAKPGPGVRWRENPVYDPPEKSAIEILSAHLGIEPIAAREALRALIKGGYIIAPMLPTNSMLLGYMNSYGTSPSSAHGTIIAAGKAKKRWQAMATYGLKVSMTLRPQSNEHKNQGLAALDDSPDSLI